MLDGYGDPKPPDEMSRQLLDRHSDDIQKFLGIKYDHADVIHYQTKVVAGINFMILAESDTGIRFNVVIYKMMGYTGIYTLVTECTFYR